MRAYRQHQKKETAIDSTRFSKSYNTLGGLSQMQTRVIKMEASHIKPSSFGGLAITVTAWKERTRAITSGRTTPS